MPNEIFSNERINIVGDPDEGSLYFIPVSEAQENTSLYHYTDLNAILSILQNKQLWLTDFRYLNDSEELFDGVKLVEEELHDEQGLLKLESSRESKQHFISDQLQSARERMSNVFITSFSEKIDLLSQWRAYGQFCIELDRSKVQNIKCVYSREEKRLLARKMLAETLRLIDSGEVDSVSKVESILSFVRLEYLLGMKNEGFSEECEHRLVIWASGDSSNTIQFRVRDDLIIPYITWDLDPAAIKAIHVGPVKDKALSKSSISNLLNHLQKKYPGVYDHITVEESKIPYRV